MTAAIILTNFHLSFRAIAQMSAARIVDCLVEGTLVAAFAGLVLRMARRWNSGARFAVWFSALMAMAALPLLATARNYAARFVGALAVWGMGWSRRGRRGAGRGGFVASARVAPELRCGRCGRA